MLFSGFTVPNLPLPPHIKAGPCPGVLIYAGYVVIVSIVGLLEAGGFICRILMFKEAEFSRFLPAQCLLIIPPSFLALVQYLTLGKAVRARLLTQTESCR
jgi:hypothetical protein